MTIKELKAELNDLTNDERVYLAYWLLKESIEISNQVKNSSQRNPLLEVAGSISGGPSDVAGRAEEILMDGINPISGFTLDS